MPAPPVDRRLDAFWVGRETLGQHAQEALGVLRTHLCQRFHQRARDSDARSLALLRDEALAKLFPAARSAAGRRQAENRSTALGYMADLVQPGWACHRPSR